MGGAGAESQLHEAVRLPGFSGQMRDVIDFRTMDYYRKRYEKLQL